MRKITLAAALVAVALTVSGCKSAGEWIEEAGRIIRVITTATHKVRDAIKDGCTAVGKYEVQAEAVAAAVGQCKSFHTRVVQIRTSIAAVCQNVDLLTDKEAGNYAATVGQAVKAAELSRPAGC